MALNSLLRSKNNGTANLDLRSVSGIDGLSAVRLPGFPTKILGIASLLLILVTVAVLAPELSFAHYFGGRYADNDQHRYASIEETDAHHDELDPFVVDSMYWDYEYATDSDINAINDGRQSIKPGTHVDVYWFVTPQSDMPKSTALGAATCMVTMGGNKCDQFRIKFSEDRLIGSSDVQKAHTVCHEIGHTFGSDDGLKESTGCWPQSKFSLDGNTNDHEIKHLKHQY